MSEHESCALLGQLLLAGEIITAEELRTAARETDVPEDAAVRLDVREGGSGSVRVPARFERTRRGDDDEGTWETPGYDSADHKIEIVIEDLGSGAVQVR